MYSRLFFFLLTLSYVASNDQNELDYKFEPLGCFQDDYYNRLLTHKLFNKRSQIDWHNFPATIDGFITECAKKAYEKGYRVFGIEYYGECYAAKTVDENKKGSSESCIAGNYTKIGKSLPGHAVGGDSAIYIYKIVHNPHDFGVKLEPVGCFQDMYGKDSRLLPTELLNERDSNNPAYGGRNVDWVNYDFYLPNFIARCAKKAFDGGHRLFGTQYFGECWVGDREDEKRYNQLGKSDQCVDEHFQDVTDDTTNCVKAIGKNLANYIYRVAPTSCDTYYEPIGCFADDLKLPRPLPYEISNEREYSSSVHNNHLIDWRNWNTYSPEMICRCAEEAKKKEHDYFGMQFYGECWSGKISENVEGSSGFRRHGKSTECLAEDFEPCPCNSYHCVGKARTSHVYKLTTGPAVQNATP